MTKKVSASIYISQDLLQKIETEAQKQNRSTSNLIETHLRKAYQPQ